MSEHGQEQETRIRTGTGKQGLKLRGNIEVVMVIPRVRVWN